MCKFCDATRPTLTRAPADAGGASARVAPSALPSGIGQPGRKTLIRGGHVLSVDPGIGNFARGDVLIEGSKILAIAPQIDAPDAAVIDATGHVVMPGFIDTHHHQFETALRSILADAILVSGPVTGEPADQSQLKKVCETVKDVPVFANTGVNIDNVKDTLALASGVIIGTHFKVGGITWNPVDGARVKRFMDKVETLR